MFISLFIEYNPYDTWFWIPNYDLSFKVVRFKVPNICFCKFAHALMLRVVGSLGCQYTVQSYK